MTISSKKTSSSDCHYCGDDQPRMPDQKRAGTNLGVLPEEWRCHPDYHKRIPLHLMRLFEQNL